jgi:hypothetical protein
MQDQVSPLVLLEEKIPDSAKAVETYSKGGKKQNAR